MDDGDADLDDAPGADGDDAPGADARAGVEHPVEVDEGVDDHSVVDGYLARLLDRDDVPYEEVVDEFDDPETYEAAKARAAELKGAVVVAVDNDDGEVLLVENDWMDGYGFPGGGVEPGEGWEDAAVREVREETGVEVALDRPWRVYGGYSECGGRRYRGLYAVVYRATPVGDATVADDPGVGDETIEDAGWFETLPDRVTNRELVAALFDDGR